MRISTKGFAPPCEAFKEGWLRIKKNVTLRFESADGMVLQGLSNPETTTPSALISEALLFIIRAATPP